MHGSLSGSPPVSLPSAAFDPNDSAFIRDPYPRLSELRERLPVFHEPRRNEIFFLRYDDIASVLRSRCFGRSIGHVLSRAELGWPPPDPRQAAFDLFEENHLMSSEPPRHTRLRELVGKAFTPKRVEGLRARISAIVDATLDGLATRNAFDLVRDFAEPLPVIVISELLGVSAAYHARLRTWSAAIVKLYELDRSEAQQAAANAAVIAFSAHLRELCAARRAAPQDDLISALVGGEDDGERMSEDELIGTCILLLNAGHEASVNGTVQAVHALMRRPQEWERLVASAREPGPMPPLIKTAVDELLRFDSPLPLFERWVLEDTEIAGVRLTPGMRVGLLYASGNRDPAMFAQPDVLDLGREPNPHLTFGLGIHYCLGAPLARLEMQIALRSLARRLPQLRLANERAAVSYGTGFVIRGISELPVLAGRTGNAG